MVPHLVLFCALQQLAVEPYPATVGDPVVVRAIAPAGPMAGLGVAVVQPDGTRRELGTTDGAGVARFVPEVAGEHQFVAERGGTTLLAPLPVLPPRRRTPYILVCAPLGLVLLFSIWRRPAQQPHAR